MPELQVYDQQTFPSHLHWQAVSFIRIEWPLIAGGMIRQTYPAEVEPIHFALVEDDLLLSYAAVIHTRLIHAEQAYATCGLGSVFTYPACRNKGYGRRIVDAATHYIQQSSVGIGLLFAQATLEAFYAKSGWQAIKGTPLFVETMSEEATALKMMLFVSEKGQAGRTIFETQPLYVPQGWW